MSIRILEDAVVDQIAAGEVVERPASVLKELVENALDAGATRIDVALRDGGSRMLQVADNGCGMSPDDAMLCIERHATSKIRGVNDLVGIRSLGFRGEAMPSIASVSRFELRTRPHDAEQGTCLKMEGGRLDHVGPIGCAPGTEIAARDLFFNIPARRKFLRTRQTELGHCLEGVHRQILMRPDVDVTVTHDGREVLRAPASADPTRRLADLLGLEAERWIAVQLERDGVHVQGFVAPVGEHRSTSGGAVYTYVDGRFVRDPVVRRAVTEAYRGLLPKGRHPLVVIAITLPPGEVDVNVHPAKTEVRFHSPRTVMQVLTDAVREALQAPPPAYPVRGTVPASTKDQLDLLRPAHDPMPPADLVAPASGAPVTGAAAPLPNWMGATPPVSEPVVAERVSSGPSSAEPTPPPEPVRPPSPPKVVPQRWTIWTRLGTMALAKRGEAVWCIDLAALTEHRTLRTLQQGREAGGVTAQPLLVPARVELSRAHTAALVAQAEALSALGVELSAFGPSELAVMALPRGVALAGADAVLTACAQALSTSSDTDLAVVLAAQSRVPDSDGLLADWLTQHADVTRVGRPLTEPDLVAWMRRGA